MLDAVGILILGPVSLRASRVPSDDAIWPEEKFIVYISNAPFKFVCLYRVVDPDQGIIQLFGVRTSTHCFFLKEVCGSGRNREF
jgi:hypothetical protein